MAKNHQSMNLFLLSLSMFELKCTGQSETEFTGQSQTENGGHSETKYTGQSQTEFTVQSATKNDGQYVRILQFRENLLISIFLGINSLQWALLPVIITTRRDKFNWLHKYIIGFPEFYLSIVHNTNLAF